jgi:hypothetical protein
MPTTTRTNAHPARCAACRNEVPAQAGSLTRENNRWVVRHLGDCPPAITAPQPRVTTTVPEGHYAIPTVTGQNDLSFYRVDRPTEGTWAGRVFVKVMVGGRPGHAIRGAAAEGVLARIEALGHEAAARRYGQEIGRCGRCNRSLTDAVSRACGIGPDCRQLEGWLITTAEANAIYAAARKRANVAPAPAECRSCYGTHVPGLCPERDAEAFRAHVAAGLGQGREVAYA